MPDNVDTAKAIYEAFDKGDMEALGKAGSFHTDSAKAKAALG